MALKDPIQHQGFDPVCRSSSPCNRVNLARMGWIY